MSQVALYVIREKGLSKMERRIKGISFINEYTEELEKLNKEENGSRLVCELLRGYYNTSSYTMEDLKEDIEHIKSILEGD